MPAATILIVFGSWIIIAGLAVWFRVRSSDEEDGG
jgi:hypothetical protein